MIDVIIRKYGDSKAIVIPSDIAKYMGLEFGSKMKMDIIFENIVLRKEMRNNEKT